MQITQKQQCAARQQQMYNNTQKNIYNAAIKTAGYIPEQQRDNSRVDSYTESYRSRAQLLNQSYSSGYSKTICHKSSGKAIKYC